jgi:ribonuclease VapC
MIIDSSALLAIVLDEPEREAYVNLIEAAPRRLISAASFVESAIVISSRRGELAVSRLRMFLERAVVEIAGVDAEQAEAAIDAFRRFGKGRHPANLNFGDCFAYALAAVTGEPLLYKGDDFDRTDVAAVR